VEKPKKEYVMLGVSPEVHAQLKVQAAQERRSIKEVVEELILGYIAAQSDRARKEKTKR